MCPGKFVREHPVLASAVSIGMAPLQGAEFVGQALGSWGHSDTGDLGSYVPINALQNKAKGVTGTYTMAGYATDSAGRELVGIVTVEQYDGNISGIKFYDVTHAVSGRQKNTSRLQETAPEAYARFQEAVRSEAEKEARGLYELYRGEGIEMDYAGALDEATANCAGRLLQEGRVLDEFIERHRTDRSMLEKLLEAIRGLISKLTGEEKRKAQTAEGKLLAALQEGSRQAKTGGGPESAVGTDGEKFSIKFDQQGAIAVLDEKVNSERKAVLAYLEGLVSKDAFSMVLSDAQKIYVGKDLPGEYTQSEYTKNLFRDLKAAKFKAAHILNDMLLRIMLVGVRIKMGSMEQQLKMDGITIKADLRFLCWN